MSFPPKPVIEIQAHCLAFVPLCKRAYFTRLHIIYDFVDSSVRRRGPGVPSTDAVSLHFYGICILPGRSGAGAFF